jgi:NADPH-dependent 2,4-dienoyl-CoA reductase/sulfur reductase-like enzyme
VITDKGEKIESDAVIIAIGYTSNRDLAIDLGFGYRENKSIYIDEYMRTTKKDVFVSVGVTEKQVKVAKILDLNK